MKELIVIDFDKTLIPFDSFRRYLFLWLKYYPFLTLKFIMLRKLRLLSLRDFKSQFIQNISKHKLYKHINYAFAESLVKYVDCDIMQMIYQKVQNNSIVLLLSASPDAYVSIVAELVGFEGQGSYFIDKQFIHLYGKGKIEFLNKYYPNSKFHYLFSISDSKSDMELFKKFQNHKFI